MNDNRIFTTVPIIGRLLAFYGLDSIKDSHGNSVTGNMVTGATLNCGADDSTRKLTWSEALQYDKIMLKAQSKDIVGALLDDINLGEIESPLKTLCDKPVEQSR